ncbi:acetyl-CoA hydrolase/transferase family protein [Bacillus tianshenii]|nr:acetyl-CoA hydrolase/transferase family protein [Bacillus tianshenii]
MTLERIRNEQLKRKVVRADEAITHIQDGMVIGLSGFTRAGDAKSVPLALVDYAKQRPMKLDVYTGASLGNDLDGLMTKAGLIRKRLPFQVDRTMRKAINEGEVLFTDEHLSLIAEQIRSGALPAIDVAVIEAAGITEEGYIIPTTSVGNNNIFMECAKKVIIEVNMAQPEAFEGMHDIYNMPKQGEREAIPIKNVSDRIGETAIKIDPEKIVSIVLSDMPDSPSNIIPPDEETKMMAEHLIQFLKDEVASGRLPNNLAPLQSGIGSVANAVLHGLVDSEFENLEIYSEVLQDSVFELLDSGKASFASGCSITLSPDCMERVFNNLDEYKDKIVLRPQEISNHPEIIRRLGLIAINTALEVDIYGNVNSTHVLGTKMMNGIGGSGDFARNSRIAIFATKSIAKNGDISSIVPFSPHIDHVEHDVDVIVTEQGAADLRGLSPRERAVAIIENCAHPSYREALRGYFDEACKRGGHTPHMLEKALSWHSQFEQTGSMRKAAESLTHV